MSEADGGKGMDPVTIAQEVDRDYSASVEGIVIPGAWVKSAIDADVKLGVKPTGAKGMSLDVADEGVDQNAVCRSHGILIEGTEEWSGKGADIYATVQRAFNICDRRGYASFDYDLDGLGAGVRGDARIINENRVRLGAKAIQAAGWRGSEAVIDPDGVVEGTSTGKEDKGRTNKDYFMNRKAQGWWSLRRRFQKTHRWVTEGIKCGADEIVSISSKCPNYQKLVAELSQPTFAINGIGKMLADKQLAGRSQSKSQTRPKSPNTADACMIRFAPKEQAPAEYTPELTAMIRQFGAAPAADAGPC